jgi:5-oxoprolinase (ATP-hydrolysing) subunit A
VFGAPVLGMLGTLHETIYPKRGLPFVAEFYSDLDYADDGSLIITRVHDAKDPQQAADRCRRAIAEGRVQSVGGREVRVGTETICVHSDTPNALEIAAAVRAIVARDPQPSN